ncbi:hypothetical protein ACH4U6_35505 [Streptomyces netropsis]|uniref:hypothetical protein n=1 Tax=Streptomyces netropsis TaxID=55404 RepID=UPI0037B1D474
MIGVVLDAGPRSGELCRQGVEGLAPDLSETQLRRWPQGTPVDAPDPAELL